MEQDYNLNTKNFPRVDKYTFWIVTWIETHVYSKGENKIKIYLVNSKSSTLILKHILDSKVTLELPFEWLNKIKIGSVFDYEGKHNPNIKAWFKSTEFTYNHIENESFTAENDKLLSIDNLKSSGYPLPYKKVNGFKYFRILRKKELIIVPEYILLQHFYFTGNSSDGISSIIKNTFFEDTIIETDIVKKNGIVYGHVKYNNEQLNEFNAMILSMFLFLENDSGKKSINDISNSKVLNNYNYFNARLPFDAEIQFFLEGRFFDIPESYEKIEKVFLAMNVRNFRMIEKNIIKVDQINLFPKFETNTTDERHKKEKKEYKQKRTNSSIKSNSPIVDKTKSYSPRESKDLPSFFETFGIKIPVKPIKRNDQNNHWVKSSTDVIITNEETYSTNKESSKSSNSKGINLRPSNKFIEKSFHFFHNIIIELRRLGICGKYISIDTTADRKNYMVFKGEKIEYYILRIKKENNFFYLVRFHPSFTNYIALINHNTRKELNLDDLKLIISLCKRNLLNLWKIKRKKTLAKLDIEHHNFTHTVPNNEEPESYIASKIKVYIDKY